MLIWQKLLPFGSSMEIDKKTDILIWGDLSMTVLLNATERSESAKKVRRMGYVPGNIYGPGIDRNLDVQFKESEVNKFLKNHSTGAKTKVRINGDELTCVVKGIQYELMGNKPIHIELYTSSENKLVKVKVPIRIKGKEKLAKSNLVLNTLVDKVEIQGVLKDLPEFIDIDVSLMKEGDEITMGDITLPEGIKLLSGEDEVVLTAIRPSQTDQTEQSELVS